MELNNIFLFAHPISLNNEQQLNQMKTKG